MIRIDTIVAIVLVLGAFVALHAWLARPLWLKHLDRLWLWCVGIAALIIVPLFLMVAWEDGSLFWLVICTGYLTLIVSGVVDGLRSGR